MSEFRAYYAVIPAPVRYDETIPSNAKLLYGEITALCNIGGVCLGQNTNFSGLYKVCKGTVHKWIKAL